MFQHSNNDMNNKPLTKILSFQHQEYTFYDGPPFATGLPHYGHILAGTSIKDVVTRYAAMTGHVVERRAGWDCHCMDSPSKISEGCKVLRENFSSCYMPFDGRY